MTDLPPDGTIPGREVLLLANPVAGSRGQRYHVQELAHALRARGLGATLCWDREELPALVRARAGRLRCIVVAGGDGTLNEVLNRAPGVPVAILPLGNENLVARHFRLGRSASRLAGAIATAPARHLDLARLAAPGQHGRFFSLMAGIGIDAQVVHDVHRDRRGHVNKLTYALAALHSLGSYRFPAITVDVAETGERLCGAAVFLFNLPVYGLGLPIATQALADDGWLDLFVFERPGLLHLARYLAAILRGRQARLADVHHRRVRRVHLFSDPPAPVQTDGDPAGSLPVTIEVAPAALTLLLPE